MSQASFQDLWIVGQSILGAINDHARRGKVAEHHLKITQCGDCEPYPNLKPYPYGINCGSNMVNCSTQKGIIMCCFYITWQLMDCQLAIEKQHIINFLDPEAPFCSLEGPHLWGPAGWCCPGLSVGIRMIHDPSAVSTRRSRNSWATD